MRPFLETLRDFGRPLSVAILLAVLLLGAVISGILNAISPGLGDVFTQGIAGWFNAIPAEYYTLTGAMALGYTASRGVEKAVRHMRKPPSDDEFEELTE